MITMSDSQIFKSLSDQYMLNTAVEITIVVLNKNDQLLKYYKQNIINKILYTKIFDLYLLRPSF